MLQNPAGTAARELCPGLQPATLQCSATCKILSQGHPINQKIVLACHHQDSTPVLVSANGYHPRVQHTEQISNTQACTCLTKIQNRSVAFVPQHVGSTGAEWSAMVESNQCFPVGPRLDVEVYGNAHQVFEVPICTICVDQLQNGPPKSPQNQKIWCETSRKHFCHTKSICSHKRPLMQLANGSPSQLLCCQRSMLITSIQAICAP